MTRVRRRLGFCVVIAVVTALIGGGSVAHDGRASHVNATQLSRSVAAALAPVPAPVAPASSPGAIDPPALVDTLATSGNNSEAVIKQAPSQFEGDAPKPVAPPAALSQNNVSSQSAGGGTWAVVVGVNDYPGSHDDLAFAVNDANDMAEALSGMGVEGDHIVVLRDGQVTRATLLNSIAWLASHAGSDSVAGFFYAGHVRKANGGNEEIVASDGSALSDRDLARALSHVAANRSWVAIAACYGGGFTEVLRPGRVLTGAAGPNDLAYENSSIGRSYMVEYMINQAMLQGRASATVQSAFNYAVDSISRDHPGREPVEIDDGDGALDLRPPGAAARPPAQSDPQPDPQPTPTTEPPSDQPGKNQHCTGNGLLRRCTNDNS